MTVRAKLGIAVRLLATRDLPLRRRLYYAWSTASELLPREIAPELRARWEALREAFRGSQGQYADEVISAMPDDQVAALAGEIVSLFEHSL